MAGDDAAFNQYMKHLYDKSSEAVTPEQEEIFNQLSDLALKHHYKCDGFQLR